MRTAPGASKLAKNGHNERREANSSPSSSSYFRLEEEVQQRLCTEEQLLAAQDRLKRYKTPFETGSDVGSCGKRH